MRCGFVEEGRRCPDPPVYRVEIAGCQVCCLRYGWLFCVGHAACVTHAAEIRAELYAWADDPDLSGGDLSPARVHDLTGAS